MIPTPGKRVRGSRTGRPVMAFLDLIGRRWALRILWVLHAGPARFRTLQDACAASPTVINQRLSELKAWGLVALDNEGYSLTPSAKELLVLLLPLDAWCERRARMVGSTAGKAAARGKGRTRAPG
jgi:DNA-binding HxlR family transcriptional regulator